MRATKYLLKGARLHVIIYQPTIKMEEPYRLEKLVIHRSTDAAEQLGWYKYIKAMWAEIMGQDSKLLVLGGIHGNPGKYLWHSLSFLAAPIILAHD